MFAAGWVCCGCCRLDAPGGRVAGKRAARTGPGYSVACPCREVPPPPVAGGGGVCGCHSGWFTYGHGSAQKGKARFIPGGQEEAEERRKDARRFRQGCQEGQIEKGNIGEKNQGQEKKRSPLQKGWYTPYDKWPANLKKIYSFNPARAKQLLKQAGYPKGFEAEIMASTSSDMNLLQIIKSQFQNIGVKLQIKTMDEFSKMDFVGAGKHKHMDYNAFTGGAPNPWQQVVVLTTGDRQNFTFNNDAKYDALYKKIKRAKTEAQAKRLIRQADMLALEQCWMVFFFPLNAPVLTQPYVKGYLGEGNASMGFYYISRWWIDAKMKKSMMR